MYRLLNIIESFHSFIQRYKQVITGGITIDINWMDHFNKEHEMFQFQF